MPRRRVHIVMDAAAPFTQARRQVPCLESKITGTYWYVLDRPVTVGFIAIVEDANMELDLSGYESEAGTWFIRQRELDLRNLK